MSFDARKIRLLDELDRSHAVDASLVALAMRDDLAIAGAKSPTELAGACAVDLELGVDHRSICDQIVESAQKKVLIEQPPFVLDMPLSRISFFRNMNLVLTWLLRSSLRAFQEIVVPPFCLEQSEPLVN